MKFLDVPLAMVVLLLHHVNALPSADDKNKDINGWLAENFHYPSAPTAGSPHTQDDDNDHSRNTRALVSLEATAKRLTPNKRDRIPEIVPDEDLNAWTKQNVPRDLVVKRDEPGNDSGDNEEETSVLEKRGVGNCLSCMFGCGVHVMPYGGWTMSQKVVGCLTACGIQLACIDDDTRLYHDKYGNSFPSPPPPGGYRVPNWDWVIAAPAWG